MKKFISNFFLVIFLALSFNMYAQEITVTGTVLDETGSPLPGASIVIKGTAQGTTTDFDGKYSIKVPSNGILILVL